MRYSTILFLTGIYLSGLTSGRVEAEGPKAKGDTAEAVDSDESAARQIAVVMQISDEQDGKRKVLSRPRVRSLSGQPASVQIAQPDGRTLAIDLVAVAEPNAAALPPEPSRVDQKSGGAEARPERTPIQITLSITDGGNGEAKTCCQAQLTTCAGEPASIRFGGLEVQFTASLTGTDEETNEESAINREELRLLNTLQKRISVEFSDTPLKDVIRELAKRADVNVFVDTPGLEDEGVTTQSKITASARSVRLSTVLDQVLGSLRLDYAVADEVIKITSRTRARGEPVTVTYSVIDLVTRIDNGQAVHNPQAEQELIEQITESISPETWDRNGGRGSVRIFQPTRSLVIRQVKDVHEEIAELLEQLRGERKSSGDPATSDNRPAVRALPQVAPSPPG